MARGDPSSHRWRLHGRRSARLGSRGMADADRNMFVMEEKKALRIGRVFSPEWLERQEQLAYGPTLTPYGQSCRGDCRAIKRRRRETVRQLVRSKTWSVLVTSAAGFRPKYLSGPDYSCTLGEKTMKICHVHQHLSPPYRRGGPLGVDLCRGLCGAPDTAC